MDYFAGSGTTGDAMIRLNKRDDGKRKFMLVEMGKYFETVLKPRIQKVMYSLNWKDGRPVNNEVDGYQGVVKVQRLEQYEDILNSLEPVETPEGTAPATELPLKYLYRPEQNSLRTNLDLSRPFSNRICYGRTRDETEIDLLETYLYLRGYRVRNRCAQERNGKRYVVVETTTKELIIWRDIDDDEDDTDAILEIAAAYEDIERLEINHTADLRKLPENTILVGPEDFDRGARWD